MKHSKARFKLKQTVKVKRRRRARFIITEIKYYPIGQIGKRKGYYYYCYSKGGSVGWQYENNIEQG